LRTTDGAFVATAAPSWAEEVLARLTQRYRGADGLLVTALDARGQVLDAEPLIADFGDVLPYLAYFGYVDAALDQVRRARPYLWRGLYRRRGRVQAFFNHDWLIGLIELYRLTGERWLLALATEAADALRAHLDDRGLLRDEPVRWDVWRSWLRRASPFGGGYIEPLVELTALTGAERFLAHAQRLAAAWLATRPFRAQGVFRRVFRLPLVDALAAQAPARLFKDNTNLLYGLLALYEATGDVALRQAIERWLDAFAAHVWNGGQVFLLVDDRLRGSQPELKAAFAALDLLCACVHGGVDRPRTLALARRIADCWLGEQWPQGLFPVAPGAACDHLDANTDMAVALAKLAVLTGERAYRQAADRCVAALLAQHAGPHGYVLAVGADGAFADGRIIVKYQALLLKLALLDLAGDQLCGAALPARLLRDR
jgi:hypothetical protein